jgi:hypothetical protein
MPAGTDPPPWPSSAVSRMLIDVRTEELIKRLPEVGWAVVLSLAVNKHDAHKGSTSERREIPFIAGCRGPGPLVLTIEEAARFY